MELNSKRSRALELLRDLPRFSNPGQIIHAGDLDRVTWVGLVKSDDFLKEALAFTPNAFNLCYYGGVHFQDVDLADCFNRVLRDRAFLLECAKIHRESFLSSLLHLPAFHGSLEDFGWLYAVVFSRPFAIELAKLDVDLLLHVYSHDFLHHTARSSPHCPGLRRHELLSCSTQKDKLMNFSEYALHFNPTNFIKFGSKSAQLVRRFEVERRKFLENITYL